MVMNGVSMKQVQGVGAQYLSTTADIYATSRFAQKQTGSAGVIANLLGESKLPNNYGFIVHAKHTGDEAKAVFLLDADSFESATSGGDGGGFGTHRARLWTKRFRVVLVTTASIHLKYIFHGKFTICISQIGLETWNSCC